MLQEFKQKHEEIVKRIQNKLKTYFSENISEERIPQFTKATPNFATKTLKDQRASSANQLFQQNEEQQMSNSITSKFKKRESSQQGNGRLLGQLDELRKRLKKLQKSNSCNNLLNKSDKKQRKIELSNKVIPHISKLMTQQSKMALKKKGKMSTMTKTKAK